MELRHLRYFVYVAEELHFGRAAKRAGIAQPPLSQQIRSLEAELGVELFHRTNRRVSLTDAGTALLPEARRLLRDADRAVSIARDGGLGVMGRVRLGFVGSLAFGFLPSFIRHHRQQHPRIQVDLREMTSEQQRVALTEDALDLGLVRYPLVSDGLSSELLFQESLCVALPEGHPLASQNVISMSQLAAETFILFPRHLGPAFHDQVIGLCRSAGFSPSIGQEAVQMPTAVSLVSAGSGVAIVPGSMRALHLDGMTYHDLRTESGELARAEVHFVTREGVLSKMVAGLVERARSLTSPSPQRR